MVLQTQAPVPARWRIVFAALLVLAFCAAGLALMRKDATPSPQDGAGDSPDARIRLQTAAVAFSSGKLAPRILILTDRPEFYRNEDATPPEFRFFRGSGGKAAETAPEADLIVIDPASVPELGLGGPRDAFFQFRNNFSKYDNHPIRGKRDPGAGSLERTVGNSGAVAAKFDVVLLDCVFPGCVFSRKTLLWSSSFFDMMKREAMNSGGVFAILLPPDRPADSACILAFLRRSFGNAGAFCFGDRVHLASGLNAEPVFDLEKLNATAELAGYYDVGGIPGNAISLILDEDYSDSIPAGLLEAADAVTIPDVFTSFRAVFARARFAPRLKRFLPDGFPVRKVCAWLLGILLVAYPFLRYFISWKPVHKQAFRAFEDMFCLTGVLVLFLLFTNEEIRNYGMSLLLYLVIIVMLCYSDGKWSGKWARAVAENPIGRFFLHLLAALAFGLVFFRVFSAPIPTGLTVCFGVILAVWPIRAKMKEPVQPGPAIPLAFAFGVVASLALFAASLCFPLGPVVFAAVVCGSRLVFFD